MVSPVVQVVRAGRMITLQEEVLASRVPSRRRRHASSGPAAAPRHFAHHLHSKGIKVFTRTITSPTIQGPHALHGVWKLCSKFKEYSFSRGVGRGVRVLFEKLSGLTRSRAAEVSSGNQENTVTTYLPGHVIIMYLIGLRTIVCLPRIPHHSLSSMR